jgi:hypothetical protein
MKRALLVIALTAVCMLSVTLAFAWPVDDSYAPSLQGPCDRCLAGVNPALSQSYWVVGATSVYRHPEMPCARVRINGRETRLGDVMARVKGELMVPITAASEFGMVATRSALNGREMTIANAKATVVMNLGSRTVLINKQPVTLAAGPAWHNGKVYMPFAAVGKKLGWTFKRNPVTATLDVTTG